MTLDDTPHRIALGMAIGVFIAWTPTVGVQMLAVIPIACLLGANRIAGLIGVYLSNPLTFLPMYWLDYRFGAALLGNPLTFDEFRGILAREGWAECWWGLVGIGLEMAVPMWLGGIILGTISGLIGYAATFWLVGMLRPSKFPTLARSHQTIIATDGQVDCPIAASSLGTRRNGPCRASEV
ncbi:MAG: DUF2062 domain-containing protein [Pirellulaceae bacterium]|jgi:uncharacterized protein (DUF2062 family)|nr:DUF2062 domain-containing protein [Pirellulaceae bacterium]